MSEQGGWAYFPDYDEVETVASEPPDAISDLTRDEKRERLRAIELVKKLRRKTRPGVDHCESLRRAFITYDTDEDNQLDRNEFLSAMRNYLGDELPATDADCLFAQLDVDHDEHVTLDELVSGVTNLGKHRPPTDKVDVVSKIINGLKRQTRAGFTHSEALSHAFKRFDISEDGFLGREELFSGIKNYLGRHAKTLTREDMNQVFDQFDKDGSEMLSVDEFIQGVENYGTQNADRKKDGLSVTELVNKLKKKIPSLDVSHFSDPEKVDFLKRAFAAFDTNEDGTLDFDEYHAGLQNYLGHANLPVSVTKRMFDNFDKDNTGDLKLHEFAEGVVYFDGEREKEGSRRGSNDSRGSFGSRSRVSNGSVRSRSSRGSNRSMTSSRHSRGTGRGSKVNHEPLHLQAPEVWQQLKEYISEVGEDRFSITEFEEMLLEDNHATVLTYKTQQRVKVAAEKLLGAQVHGEFSDFN
jgi:Ca2+-binding EF-hand superfamily protein